MGFFEKLKNGLKKTKDSMMGRIESLLHSFSKIDEDLFEELEETLILCDIGVTTSEKICDKLLSLITHLRAHETPEHLVCRLLLEKKNIHISEPTRLTPN